MFSKVRFISEGLAPCLQSTYFAKHGASPSLHKYRTLLNMEPCLAKYGFVVKDWLHVYKVRTLLNMEPVLSNSTVYCS